jgi:hypothetical protein
MVGSGACIMRAQVYNCDPIGETLARPALDANFGTTGGAAVSILLILMHMLLV